VNGALTESNNLTINEDVVDLDIVAVDATTEAEKHGQVTTNISVIKADEE